MMGWDTAFYYLIASLLISYAVAYSNNPAKPQPVAFEDLDIPQAEEGTEQAVVFGDVFSGDWTVLWYGNYRTTEVRSSGGKK